MIRKIILIIFLLSGMKASAQKSVLKAGVNLNADVIDHKLGKLTYPSWEINYERLMRNNLSLSIGFNYAVRDYTINSAGVFFSYLLTWGNERWKNTDCVFIPEFRYYLHSNHDGLFFQMGFPFTYTTEKSYYYSPAGVSVYSQTMNALSIFAGLGLKCSIGSHVGVEMNMNFSPSANLFGDVDYGTSGFIKSGVKVFYLFGKPSDNKKEEKSGNSR